MRASTGTSTSHRPRYTYERPPSFSTKQMPAVDPGAADDVMQQVCARRFHDADTWPQLRSLREKLEREQKKVDTQLRRNEARTVRRPTNLIAA